MSQVLMVFYCLLLSVYSHQIMLYTANHRQIMYTAVSIECVFLIILTLFWEQHVSFGDFASKQFLP